jgi:hypothetical protein
MRKRWFLNFSLFIHCYSLFEIWGWKWVLEFKCLIFWNWREIMNSISSFCFFDDFFLLGPVYCFPFLSLRKVETRVINYGWKLDWMLLFEWLMLRYTQEKGDSGFKSTPRVHYSCVLVWLIYMMNNLIFKNLLMQNRCL